MINTTTSRTDLYFGATRYCRPMTAARDSHRDLSTRGRLLAAADQMLDNDDSARLTIEAVATAAGVSRTTAYRAFGNTTELAGAILVSRLEAHRQSVLEIGSREKDVIGKIEAMTLYALIEIARSPVLKRLADVDDLADSPTLRSLATEIMQTPIEEGQATGEIRRDVEAAEIVDWLLETAFSLARLHYDETMAQRRLKLFVRPALLHNPPSAGVLAVVDTAEARLVEVQHLLDTLRGTDQRDR